MINVDEFRFNSGRIALDLPATVRRRASEPQDVLAPSGAPARWLRDAGLSHELLALSPEQTPDPEKPREAIWADADSAAAERGLPADAVATLNEMAALPLEVPTSNTKTVPVKLIAGAQFPTSSPKHKQAGHTHK